MKVNPQQFLEDGFVIIRECVPPKQLDKLRDSFEILVERQKEIWRRNRNPDHPPGSTWETSAQPRLGAFNALIDETTADTVEFCLHENTMGVCRQLMRAKEAGAQNMFFMCSPVRDHGPAHWHRDIHPFDQAPLCSLEIDLLLNAPGYLQWNIALYDDDVLWVIPKSHRRANTEAENRQLLENPRIPLPKGIPVKLKAGDGVVYTNTILHWGSNYSRTLRRTIHLGYRSFGGPIFPYVCHFHRDLGFTKYLSPTARETFERHVQLYEKECDVIGSTFRAIIDKNAQAVRDGLAVLHPGERGRIVCVILLSKIVFKMRLHHHPEMHAGGSSRYGGDISQDKDLVSCFSREEIDTLWQRFATLDAKLQSAVEQYTPGFQAQRMHYFFEEMPADFDVEDFIASWKT